MSQQLSQYSFDALLSAIVSHHTGSLMPEGLAGHDFTAICNAMQQNYNDFVGEFNDLVDTLEERDKTIETLELKNVSVSALLKKSQAFERKAAESLLNSEKTLLKSNTKAAEADSRIQKANEQYNKQLNETKSIKKQLEKSDAELTKVRKENNRSKAQVTRLKESLATAKKAVVPNAKTKIAKLVETTQAMQRELIVYRQAENATQMESYVAPLHNLYADSNCHVLLVDKPQLVRVSDTDKEIYQYTLLFAHGCGTYYTYCLSSERDDKGNPHFVISSGLFAAKGTSDEEIKRLSQHEVQVPAHIEAAIEKWLVKVNIEQDGKLLAEDYHLHAKGNIYPSANAVKRAKQLKNAA